MRRRSMCSGLRGRAPPPEGLCSGIWPAVAAAAASERADLAGVRRAARRKPRHRPSPPRLPAQRRMSNNIRKKKDLGTNAQTACCHVEYNFFILPIRVNLIRRWHQPLSRRNTTHQPQQLLRGSRPRSLLCCSICGGVANRCDAPRFCALQINNLRSAHSYSCLEVASKCVSNTMRKMLERMNVESCVCSRNCLRMHGAATLPETENGPTPQPAAPSDGPGPADETANLTPTELSARVACRVTLG